MQTRVVEDLLAAHADGLNAGQERGPELLRQAPAAAEAAESLVALAGRVKRALPAVTPRPAFVAALKAQLTGARAAAPAGTPARPRPSRMFWALAGLGGVVSVASAVLLVARWLSGNTKMRPAQ